MNNPFQKHIVNQVTSVSLSVIDTDLGNRTSNASKHIHGKSSGNLTGGMKRVLKDR